MNILDEYEKRLPSEQNAIDLFKGEWSCQLPSPYQELTGGSVLAFADPRISWAIDQLGSINGCSILELGPLEAGHTYMLEQLGADSILAIESNMRSYLKCLIVKEILGLKRAKFSLGDFIPYLQQSNERYDVCIASGVLYHMREPAQLLDLISLVSEKVMIWTHYYDQELIAKNPNIPANKFTDHIATEYQGFQHHLHRYNYRDSLKWSGFCGGSEEFSMWMSKPDILSCLEHLDFCHIDFSLDTTDHPNGPCFCVVASKS